VHPRCTPLLAAGGTQPRQPSRTRSNIILGLRIGMVGLNMVDTMTGGFMSPVLDAMNEAIDNMLEVVRRH
jgi:hypothetical protein